MPVKHRQRVLPIIALVSVGGACGPTSGDWIVGTYSFSPGPGVPGDTLLKYEVGEDHTVTQIEFFDCGENDRLRAAAWERRDGDTIAFIPMDDEASMFGGGYAEWRLRRGERCNEVAVEIEFEGGGVDQTTPLFRGDLCLHYPPDCPDFYTSCDPPTCPPEAPECPSTCETVWCDEPTPACD